MLVVHPVRKRTRGRSGIFAWQGGGRRRADARQGRQRNHAEIPPGIWFVFWPDVPLDLSWTFMQIESILRFSVSASFVSSEKIFSQIPAIWRIVHRRFAMGHNALAAVSIALRCDSSKAFVEHSPVVFSWSSFLPRVFRRQHWLNSLPLFICYIIIFIFFHALIILLFSLLCIFYFSNKS